MDPMRYEAVGIAANGVEPSTETVHHASKLLIVNVNKISKPSPKISSLESCADAMLEKLSIKAPKSFRTPRERAFGITTSC